jgi:hypothetical protein
LSAKLVLEGIGNGVGPGVTDVTEVVAVRLGLYTGAVSKEPGAGVVLGGVAGTAAVSAAVVEEPSCLA